MAIWGKLLGAGAGLALGGPLGALVGGVVGHAVIDRGIERRRAADPALQQVAFSIAAIALAAKMAAADGHASDAEFAAFQRLFHVEPAERQNVARFYDLARRSPLGFELYARQMVDLVGPGSPLLCDLLDVLFVMARADGGIADDEIAYLRQVADIFGLDGQRFQELSRFHGDAGASPYAVLGLTPDASLEDVRTRYRALAKRHHPDLHVAAGTPAPFARLAETRMATINAAYRAIMDQSRSAA